MIFQNVIFLRYVLRTGIVGSSWKLQCGILFWRNCRCFSTVAALISIPQQCKRFPSSPTLSMCFISLLMMTHSQVGVRVASCVSEIPFSTISKNAEQIHMPANASYFLLNHRYQLLEVTSMDFIHSSLRLLQLSHECLWVQLLCLSRDRVFEVFRKDSSFIWKASRLMELANLCPQSYLGSGLFKVRGWSSSVYWVK